jgi:hypothetical protein
MAGTISAHLRYAQLYDTHGDHAGETDNDGRDITDRRK